MFTGMSEDNLRYMPRCYLPFETGPLVLTDLYSLTWYLAKQTRPVDQGAQEICQPLPVQFWKHKCTPQYPGFVWVGPRNQAQILRLTGKTVFYPQIYLPKPQVVTLHLFEIQHYNCSKGYSWRQGSHCDVFTTRVSTRETPVFPNTPGHSLTLVLLPR